MQRRFSGLWRTVAVLGLVGVLCAGCSRGDGRSLAPVAGGGSTSTTGGVAAGAAVGAAPTTTAEPTTTIPVVSPPVTGPAHVTPGLASAATSSCPAISERPAPRTDRPAYRMSLDVKPDEGSVEGTETVSFTPDIATDRLVFRLWANNPHLTSAGAGITVSVDGGKLVNPTTLVVMRSLRAGQTTSVDLSWTLTLPTSSTNDRLSRTGSAIRLGSFFPVLAWHPGVGWATEPPTSVHGETSLTLPSDFDVTMTVPDGLKALASGAVVGDGHWVGSGMGDWAASIGDFRIVTGTADGGGVEVPVTVGVDRQLGDSADAYLAKAEKVISDFGKRFGTYPWPGYTLALTPDLSGGIEYPGHVMQGPGSLGRSTSHEIGHQWFYALVPTNQAANPWIDEGLASWAEARFEGTLGSFESRPIPADAAAHAGEPMTFWESRSPSYYRGVYVQTVKALGGLGSPDRVDCALRLLVARQAYRITGPGDVLDALSTVFPNARDVLAPYGISAP